MAADPLLEVQGVSKGFGGLEALSDVSLALAPGEILGLIGPNGAGKTTTLRTISGLLTPRRGRVLLEAERLDTRPAHQVAAAEIGHVPEARRLFANMTVRENLLMGTFRAERWADREAALERVFGTFPRLAERRDQLARVKGSGLNRTGSGLNRVGSDPARLRPDPGGMVAAASEPAARAAREGFRVDRCLAQRIAENQDYLAHFPESRRLLHGADGPRQAGERMASPLRGRRGGRGADPRRRGRPTGRRRRRRRGNLVTGGAPCMTSRLASSPASTRTGRVRWRSFAVQAIREAGIRLEGDLLVQSVIEEEATGNGTLACIARGYAGDAALIPEPFDQKILLGHLGVLWVRAVIRGRAGHAMGASTQVNAIDQMVRYHGWLRALEREWNVRRHPAFAEHDHPLNFNPGVVQGGVWPSSVPSEVTLVTRFACYPDVTPDEAKRQFLAFMEARQREDEWFRTNPIEFTWYGHHDHGYVVPREDPFIQQVARAHAQVTGRPAEYTTVTGVTDTRFWTVHLGKPATCYGPVGAGLHGADEWVDLESVRQVTKVIASVVLDFCGVA